MKKNQEITIRSSAAEYLTFVASTGDSKQSVEMRYEDENIWLTQKMMATLYDVTIPAVNQHIKKIYEDRELTEEATIKKFLIVQTEGNRQVSREVVHYNLQMIISVGFKVNNERAVQFRKWANVIVKDYTIKGWVMDEERLKNGGSILTKEYFEKQLEKVREIRMSERRFYQKITDMQLDFRQKNRTPVNLNSTKPDHEKLLEYYCAPQSKTTYVHLPFLPKSSSLAQYPYDTKCLDEKDNTNYSPEPLTKLLHRQSSTN